MAPTYSPKLFDVASLDAAKQVILTPEGVSTAHRWRTETPYLGSMAAYMCNMTSGHWDVLDYGCGVGRMSKELIENYGATVTGVDISQAMLDLAVDYVGKGHPFKPQLVSAGLPAGHFDTAVAVWVLQHCEDPAQDIRDIWLSLKPGGCLFIVNQIMRAVPVDRDTNLGLPFHDDGLDIAHLVRETFAKVTVRGLDPQAVGEQLYRLAYIMVAQK